MFKEASDEQLMTLICKGERAAFEMLYDRYFEKLVWYAKGFIEDMHRSEDVVQDVFVKIIERPEQFDKNRKFSTWVYTVTGNACRNILRNDQNRQRLIRENLTPDNDHTIMHPKADARMLEERIKAVHDTLNEKERNIYTLRFEQELTIREIAAIAKIPEGSVKSGIYYLLKKIAAHIKDLTHEQ